MTVRVTLTFKRPNTSVSWHEPLKDSDTLKNYWQTNFVDTGKITSFNITDSEDNLTRTMVTDFSNESAMQSYRKDDTIKSMMNDRDVYNIFNSISFEMISEDV